MDEAFAALKGRVAVPNDSAARRLEAIEREQKVLAEMLEAQKQAFDAAIAGVFTATLPHAMSWRFDARMPNTLSDTLSLPERDGNGNWLRWVLGSSLLQVNLTMAPRRQYDLTVVAPKFHSQAASRSFYARANGQDLEWLRWEGIERATTFELGDEGSLALILAVRPEDGADAPFAISSIELKAR